MKKMKSGMVVLLCFMMSACTYIKDTNKTIVDPDDKTVETDTEKEKIKKYKRDETPGEIITITLAEMEEKMVKGETFVVSFVTTYCMYCQEFDAMLEEYIKKHHVVMYQVILDKENATENENLQIIHKYFKEFFSTPGIFYAKDGQNASYLDTYNLGMDEEVFDAWVKQNQIDKKQVKKH